jgi:hypothetical protein
VLDPRQKTAAILDLEVVGSQLRPAKFGSARRRDPLIVARTARSPTNHALKDGSLRSMAERFVPTDVQKN